MQMKKLLKSVVLPENALEKALPLKKGIDAAAATSAKTKALGKAASVVGKAEGSLKKEGVKVRKPKKEDSEVTLDSEGLPAMFRSPAKKTKAAKAASVWLHHQQSAGKGKLAAGLQAPAARGAPAL